MYFPLLILHSWGKRSAAQPQAIYSEVPKHTVGALCPCIITPTAVEVRRNQSKNLK